MGRKDLKNKCTTEIKITIYLYNNVFYIYIFGEVIEFFHFFFFFFLFYFNQLITHMILYLILSLTTIIVATNIQGITLDLHRAEFQHLDLNHDNYLDDDEIALLSEDESSTDPNDPSNLQQSDIVAFVVELDTNNDGKISWKEYESSLINDHPPTLESLLPEEFENVDGFVKQARDFVESNEEL